MTKTVQMEGLLRTARQTHHSNQPYGGLCVMDEEHSPGVFSRPEGLR